MSVAPNQSATDALAQALRLHQGGDLAGAASGYRAVLEKDARNPDALHLLGLVHLANGDAEAAAASIQAAIAQAPDSGVYHFNLASAHKRAGRLDDAISSYRRALELSPDDADTLNNLSNALLEAGDRDGALDCLARAHALQPGDAQIACNLGELLFGLDRLAEAAQCFQAALRSDPTLAEAHNNLGAVRQSLGDNARAAESYARALRHAPDFASAHKNLAGVLHLLGRRDEAVAHYREALRLAPEYAEAAYELAALEGDTRAAPPSAYVAGVFDQYAHEYDAHMTGVLGYTVPAQLRALLAPHLPQRRLDVLDLGCGTGLSGAVFRDVARTLTGIDLAPKMIAKARERGIYDELIAADVVAAIHTMTRRFDLIVAADVFVYLGELDAVFRAARRVLRDDGLFAYSVERGADAGYELRDAGRYAHGPDYIRALAAQHGFDVVAEQPTVLRKDFGRDIDGTLYILAPTA
jgi:predicted TPR repeat methyltransferase